MASKLTNGLPPTDYYAPNFRVEVDGLELDPETHGDVLQLKVVMDMDNMTSFDLTINNWDDKTIGFKYSDSDVFNVGNNVHVLMGYADRMLSMVTGQIASMTPRFTDSQASTLTVSGLDGMFQLRDRKPKDGEQIRYVDKADWEIAQAVAERNGLHFEATEIGEVHAEVIQRCQDDAQFLMERAKRIDYDCYVLTDPDSGESTLHFEEPTDGRKNTKVRIYQFRWGESLIQFTPTINLSRQVGSVTVRGWDDRTKQAIVATAGADDLPGAGKGGESGPQAANRSLRGKPEVVVDAPVGSVEEAHELARSLLAERAYEFVTGTGQVIGLPDLRPGDNIELDLLGTRFNGTYYVKKVTHTINDGGYRTDFEVRRLYQEETS
jgi:phage protein D